MAKATSPKKKKSTKAPPPATLNPKHELFCRFYVQNQALFGNATLSYAEAYDYKLDELSKEAVYSEPDENGRREKLEPSDYDKAYHVCAVEGSRLLKMPDIQQLITELLNEMLKDDVVDSQLAKVILQDDDRKEKIAAIREYNKLRGRIIDKTKLEVERFAVDDIRVLLSPLPQKRQDEVYAILTSALAEAELLRSEAQTQSSGSR